VSLTLHEARARAALLGDVRYDLHFDLTERDRFQVTARIGFTCREPGSSTFLELTHGEEVLLDGLPATSYDGRRLDLTDLGEHNEIEVSARVAYVTDGDGMHTFTDPADGETYVSALLGMDVAQRVFPCFDQNDLKAPVTVRVTAPQDWTVLANGRGDQVEPGEWRFAPTPPIPVAMFVVSAGPWTSRTWEHHGLPFGWHARRSMAGALDRELPELRRTTERAFDFFTTIFDAPYAFDSCDQLMTPGHNWGALETPGCITYRDEFLTPGEPTPKEVRRRAMTICHELSHLWFGDLVTMVWWEDTWLQESMADFLGYWAGERAAGYAGAFGDFCIDDKPSAYRADQRRSTHPVAPSAEDVPDVDAAAGNFDALSYSKGGSLIRQLATWLGEEDFLAGLNGFLTANAFGNATLDDFVGALDAASERDVRRWADLWLRTTGFDTISVTREVDGFRLHRDGTRPHCFTVSLYDEGMTESQRLLVDLDDEDVVLPLAATCLPNSAGETYARLQLDEESWQHLERDFVSVPDSVARAMVWSTALDRVGFGDLTVEAFLGLLTRHLAREVDPVITTLVIRWTLELLPLHVRPEGTPDALAQVAAACESGLASDPAPDIAIALTRGLAATTPDATLLQRWLLDHQTHTGLPVDPTLRWLAVVRLSRLGVLDARAIDDERIGDGTITGVLGAAEALAAMPTEQAKAAAWQRLLEPDVSNRVFESTAAGLWDATRPDLSYPYVEPYLAEAPVLARRGQAFASAVGDAFPAIWLPDPALETFARALEGDLPTVLRRSWEDTYDDLVRSR
jgi:aminopeptidase N